MQYSHFQLFLLFVVVKLRAHISMERRDFFKGAVYASLLNTLPLPRALAESSTDHPHIIHVVPDGANI